MVGVFVPPYPSSPRLSSAIYVFSSKMCYQARSPSLKNASSSYRRCSDKQIWEAFVAFDLDKNKFVGAAEIRHVLVNIGEQVSHQMPRRCLEERT